MPLKSLPSAQGSSHEVTKPGPLLDGRGLRLNLGTRTHIMGVINCTPDSFYAGSRRLEPEAAVCAGERMVAEGADLLDVGGESSRPGSHPVSAEEELRRILPVVRELARRVSVPISIDTTSAVVARAALGAGAHLVNDISALRFDADMAAVVRDCKAPVVLMHMLGRPRDMQADPSYGNLMGALFAFFEERLVTCEQQGIPRERIVIDPGLGFGKTFEHNCEIIRRLGELAAFGRPLLLGPSRKSFIGHLLDLPPEERLEGTAAAVAVGILKGAHIVRVHDVKAMVRVARVADALSRP